MNLSVPYPQGAVGRSIPKCGRGAGAVTKSIVVATEALEEGSRIFPSDATIAPPF